MGMKCNLELRLSLASSVDDGDGCGGDHKPQCLTGKCKTGGPSSNQHRWITILQNGQISACDVTELQAKIIIWWASQCRTSRKNVDQYAKAYEDRRLQVSVQLTGPGRRLSMKKSLQRFLRNRNKRVLSISPCYRK